MRENFMQIIKDSKNEHLRLQIVLNNAAGRSVIQIHDATCRLAA